MTNTGEGDLLYYVVASNDVADSCYYPDSDKWWISNTPSPVRVTEVDYYDDEE